MTKEIVISRDKIKEKKLINQENPSDEIESFSWNDSVDEAIADLILELVKNKTRR